MSLPSSARTHHKVQKYRDTSKNTRLTLEVPTHTEVCRLLNDAQTGMLPGYPESAICVQRFDDSLNSAIHTTYRNWQRSSSRQEPRDSPLEVVSLVNITTLSRKATTRLKTTGVEWLKKSIMKPRVAARV